MTIPLILDTDIGGDVDDLLALAFLLASPEVELAAVTTVYGDVLVRSRIALKLLALRGTTGVVVASGAEKPLDERRTARLSGLEGQGLLTTDDNALSPVTEPASELILRMVMSKPGQIRIAAIGPLTNLALALLEEPRLAQYVAGITIMGGVIGGAQAGAIAHDLPWVDYNFGCDPEAARIVLASGAPLRLVPLDVTMQLRIEPSDVARIRHVNDPFHTALADQVESYPRYRQSGSTYLHDPLAVATLLRPDLVTWTPIHARVETGGEYSAGKLVPSTPTASAPANAEIALAVDTGPAHTFIIERLVR